MKEITIDTEFIKLSQFLKWAGISESGAMATDIIKDGRIEVNDQVETRRGRKLYRGDKVTLDNIHEFLIIGEG